MPITRTQPHDNKTTAENRRRGAKVRVEPAPTKHDHTLALDGTDGWRRPKRRRDRGITGTLGVLLITLTATLAAIAVVVLGPLEYTASAVFSIDLSVPSSTDEPTIAPYRTELLVTAWNVLGERDPERRIHWSVAAEDAEHTLRLELIRPNPDRGRALAAEIAQAYLDRLAALAEAARSERTDGEQLLEKRLHRLRAELSRIMRQQRDTQAALAVDNPLERRDRARGELTLRRRNLTARRAQLDRASARLPTLEHRPLADHPPVDAVARRNARGADVELQQDLQELRVRLTAVRSSLLETWQASAPLLDELIAAAAATERLGQSEPAPNGDAEYQAGLERAAEAATDYHQQLRSFAQGWTRAFVNLQQGQVDPAAAEALDVQEQRNKALGDFLYASAASLTTLRDQVRVLADQSEGQARHHRLVADLTRSFHGLQAAHHRFEFAAAKVRTSANFRLAAAVKSSRGLHRRIERRQQLIEQRLEEQARQTAIGDRNAQIAALHRQIGDLRSATFRSVDAILEAQDHIESVTGPADRYVTTTALAEARTRRLGELAVEIDRTEKQLRRIAADRSVPVTPEAVHLTHCGVDPAPVNLRRRLTYGWATGVTVFMVLLLGQRLVPRRRRF
ncbi:MAG: hypothetical protein IID40_08700 [Planctomycetes bacterium]|nr:hypothetical protein [Planctomycetota bacterium]